jgi:hypothetical protein
MKKNPGSANFTSKLNQILKENIISISKQTSRNLKDKLVPGHSKLKAGKHQKKTRDQCPS